MRRNLIGILLLALALIGRLMLPIAAQAHAVDPLGDAPICAHDGATSPPGDDDGFPGRGTPCQDFCCHVAAAFVAPPATILPVEHMWSPAEWHAFGRDDAPPPLISPQWARGPPTLS